MADLITATEAGTKGEPIGTIIVNRDNVVGARSPCGFSLLVPHEARGKPRPHISSRRVLNSSATRSTRS